MGIPKMLEQGQIKGFLLDSWKNWKGQKGFTRRPEITNPFWVVGFFLMIACGLFPVWFMGVTAGIEDMSRGLVMAYIFFLFIWVVTVCTASQYLHQMFMLVGRNLSEDLKYLKVILYGSEKLSFVCHTQETLSKRAEEVLINKIAQFLVCETGLDDDFSYESVECQKKEVQEVHRLLSIFGLVDPTYDKYFDQARQFLTETEWKK